MATSSASKATLPSGSFLYLQVAVARSNERAPATSKSPIGLAFTRIGAGSVQFACKQIGEAFRHMLHDHDAPRKSAAAGNRFARHSDRRWKRDGEMCVGATG